jgi:hypothetical protein
LPDTIDDDVISTLANITTPYHVIIDANLAPPAEAICVYTDGSLLEKR